MQINKNKIREVVKESEYDLPFNKFLGKQLKLLGKLAIFSLIFLVLLGLSSFFVEGALSDNLRAFYTFDHSSGNAIDSLGVYNLTNVGVTYSSALIVNGSNYGTSFNHNNRLSRNDGLNINIKHNWSMSFWIKDVSVGTYTNDYYIIMDWRSTTGTSAYFLMNYFNTSGVRKLGINSGVDNKFDYVISRNSFDHIVITSNGSNNVIYINGVLNTTFLSTGTGNAGNNLFVGTGNNNLKGYPFIMDALGFWNETLSTDKINELYALGNGIQYPFLTPTPSVDYTPTFVSQSPSDISSTNVFGTRLNVTYNFSDTNLSGNWYNQNYSNGDILYLLPTFTINNSNFYIQITNNTGSYNISYSSICSSSFSNSARFIRMWWGTIPYNYISCQISGTTISGTTISNDLGNISNISMWIQINNLVWLNYSSSNNNVLNGTTVSSNGAKAYSSNSGINYFFLLNDNEVYPAIYNLDETIMESTIHNQGVLVTPSDWLKIEFLGLNTSKAYNLFEIMANTTGSSEIFYCNSTYTTGNPAVNNNCYQFATLSTNTFNHTHNPNLGYSKHNIFSLPINSTGFVGSVKATSTSYFLIEGSSIGTTNYYYVNNTVRTGSMQTSTNNGVSFTNQTYTVDSHIHQFSGTDSLSYNACYTNSSGSQICSTTTNDVYNLTPLPPTTPNIITPINTKYQVNSTINITWTASIPFNTSTTITSYNVSLMNSDLSFNKTINTSTNLLYQNNFNTVNLTGSHYIRIVAKDSNGLTSTSYSDQFNLTSSINISLKNAWTNTLVNNFTGWAYDSISGNNISFASGINNSSLLLLDVGNYTFYIEQPMYSISTANYYYLNLTSNLQKYQKNFSLYTNNSVVINIFDEADNSIILQNISIRLDQSNLTLATYYTNNGTYFISELPDGAYTLILGGVTGVNYTSRSYDVTVAERSTQQLNAYLINSGLTVTISALDSLTFAVIEGATVSQYRSINNSWTLVQVKSTDITGRSLFYYLANTKYRFIVQNTGYTSKQFDLDPVIYDSYSVYLEKEIVYNYVGDYEDVHITFQPWQYFANKQNNFIFIITSPEGTLENYGYNITSRCYNTSVSGNNSYGERLTKSFNLTCANYTDKITILYYYDTVYSNQKTFMASFYISGATTGSNYTFAQMGDEHYGMGDLERILIVIFFVIIIAGVTYAVAGGTFALIIGLMIYGYFTYTGFISYWFTILSIIIGVLIWLGGRE